MNSCSLGSVVVSTQGHDRGRFYVVVEMSNSGVKVCDGEFKLLAKPKMKNFTHIKHTQIVDDEIYAKLSRGLKINDQMIYHAIVKAKKLAKEGDLYGKR